MYDRTFVHLTIDLGINGLTRFFFEFVQGSFIVK